MDIKLDSNGDVAFVNGESLVTSIGAEDLAQRLLIRLRTFQGEWFMDTTYGIDWWNKVFGKNRSKASVDAIIQSEIAKEPDVVQIINYTSSVANEVFKCVFSIRTIEGLISTVNFTISPPA